MSNTTTIILPIELRKRAGVLRMNISEVCRKAVADEVQKIEEEVAGTRRAKPVTGNTTSGGGNSDVST